MSCEKMMANAYASYSFRLYTLSVIRRDISKRVAITLVKTMLMLYFDYVIHFSNSCTDKTNTKCQRLVNRSLCLALQVDRYTNPLYDAFNMMKLDIRARFNIIKLIHSRIYVTCDYDEFIVSPPSQTTRAHTAPLCILPFPKSLKFRHSFFYTAHLLWNSLLPDLRLIRNPQRFKNLLKTFVMQYN